MRVLYLHQYFNTPEMSGGTRSYEMARRLVAAGHEVHMITSRREGGAHGNDWEREVVDGINVHWFPIPYNNEMSFFRRIVSFFKYAFKARDKAISIGGDVLFATSTPLTIAIPAVRAKRKLGIPMVFEVRDLWPELPIVMGALKHPLSIFLAKRLELWAYRNAEQIVGLSPGMCEGVAKAGYPLDKIHNIPNSADISLFHVPESEGLKFRNNYPWLQERPLVIYAGTLGHINNVGYLADVAEHFLTLNPEVRFLVVGTGVDEQKIRDKALAKGIYQQNFFMISQLPKKEMPGLFSAATLSTSLFLPFRAMEANSANKFFDTLAAGKPIVINYGGWQRKLIEEFDVGASIANESPLAAASLLNGLLKDSEALRVKGSNAFSLAQSHFSRDSLAEKLISVIERA